MRCAKLRGTRLSYFILWLQFVRTVPRHQVGDTSSVILAQLWHLTSQPDIARYQPPTSKLTSKPRSIWPTCCTNRPFDLALLVMSASDGNKKEISVVRPRRLAPEKTHRPSRVQVRCNSCSAPRYHRKIVSLMSRKQPDTGPERGAASS